MIHPTAIVDSGAEVGQNVGIGPFCVIERGVVIGDGCQIGPHVSILEHTTIGANTEIHAGAVLGDTPQDHGFEDGDSTAVIGERCVIREGVTVHRGSKPGTATVIGDECYLMAFSHVAHNVRLGRAVTVANGVLFAGHVEVGDAAFISGNCLLHQFIRVGKMAMLGGGSGVSKDVPPFCMTRPVALNDVAGLNVVGMRRNGVSPEERGEVRQAFKILYRSDLSVPQAVARIRQTFAGGPALDMCDFIEGSNRGICGSSGA